MSEMILTLTDIQQIVKPLAEKYHISEVYLFGSYARNEATSASDIDFLVFGGEQFKLTSIFAFAEELRMLINKKIDVFEINEVNRNSKFYETIMKERVKVA
ncbi:MAG: nucleotidyltransferase domain-containing protein [bacterium]|nr:nucleotidyltransferase domain-containing protein [bacterium]